MDVVCRAEHIGVGSEILLGQIHNSHARTISCEFASRGFFMFHHTAVGDNFERIQDAFRIAASRSNVVVVTGGLGPTADDLTKEALAAFLKRDLYLSEEALRHLENWFRSRNRPMPEQNRKQALCITGGELLPNPNGTAPGVYVEDKGVHYFLLPGPPLEMLPMLQNEVIPRLHQIFGQQRALVSRVLHFCGIGESAVDEQISDLTSLTNPTVAPLAGEGEMLLRITATDTDETSAKARIAPIEAEIRRRFGDYIYGVDDESLPIVVQSVLTQAKSTLALAESCTGGTIASMLTAVPGSSEYLLGAVVSYHNDVKEQVLGVRRETLDNFGAVSEQTAIEMAEGVRKLCGSTYGLSVTGILGPGGGSEQKPVGLVYGAISTAEGTTVYPMQFRGSREQIRLRTTKHMLWYLWKTATGRTMDGIHPKS
jgi:nicotinamide-nucleotide amidase